MCEIWGTECRQGVELSSNSGFSGTQTPIGVLLICNWVFISVGLVQKHNSFQQHFIKLQTFPAIFILFMYDLCVFYTLYDGGVAVMLT